MTKDSLSSKDARQTLETARHLIEAGRLDDAEKALRQIVSSNVDGLAARLGSLTLLGWPRKVHSAMLKIAKKRGDIVARTGLQHHLVPQHDVLLPLCVISPDERQEMNAFNRQPVPHIIHQIWLGHLPVPHAASQWQEHADKNGFAYKLWRENDLEALGVQRHPAFLDMMEAGDFPGAVDVARYFILHAQGGIYLDCDWYPARDCASFADLLPLIGLTALAEDTPRETGVGSLLLTNSFIAAPPRHPIFSRLLDILPEATRRLPDGPAWWSTGPLIMTLLFRQTVFSVPDASIVAASLPRRAPIEAVEEIQRKAAQEKAGLLIGWKSW